MLEYVVMEEKSIHIYLYIPQIFLEVYEDFVYNGLNLCKYIGIECAQIGSRS